MKQKQENIINILYIKNYCKGKNLNCLKKFKNINLKCINSTKLINYNIENLIELIEKYDIIIIGGGKQHLTNKELIFDYPEIINQINLIKLISTKYKSSGKILIGICLGCQIIGLSYGHSIIPMDKLNVGFNFMDLNTINYSYLLKSNDKYLNKIDYHLLSKSFSFHYDYIKINQYNKNNDNNNKLNNFDELIIVVESINNVPYIITNKNSNIYGFQFHPEFTSNSIFNIKNLLNENKKFEYLINSPNNLILDEINTHFFDIFINNTFFD